MKIFWKIVAALLAVGAVAWLFVENFERAFLFAAAGAVAWFLSYRAQIKEQLKDTEETIEEEFDEEDADEKNL